MLLDLAAPRSGPVCRRVVVRETFNSTQVCCAACMSVMPQTTAEVGHVSNPPVTTGTVWLSNASKAKAWGWHNWPRCMPLLLLLYAATARPTLDAQSDVCLH